MTTIRQKTVIQGQLHAERSSHSRSDIHCRDLITTIDEPVERGGTNQGLSPTETAIAALVGCTNVIAHKCAEKLGVEIGHLKLSATYNFDRRGVTLTDEIETPFVRIALKIESDGAATQQQLNTVAKEVARYCPLAKLFRGAGTTIEEDWIAAN